MVERFIQASSKWYEKCIEEIPKEYWTSILEHQPHPDLSYDDLLKSKIDCHVWSWMYKSWLGWNNLTKKPTRVRTIRVLPNITDLDRDSSIFTISTSGNIIAIGTRCNDSTKGPGSELIVYDISKINEEPLFREINSGIEGLQVCRKGHDITVVSTKSGKVQLWDVSSKKLIHEYGNLPGTALISASLGYCYAYVNDNVKPPGKEELTWDTERLSCGIDFRMVRQKKRFKNEAAYFMMADGDKVNLLWSSSFDEPMKIHQISSGNKKPRQLAEDQTDLLSRGCYPFMIMCKPYVLLNGFGSQIYAYVAGERWITRTIDFSEKGYCVGAETTTFLYHAGFLIVASRLDMTSSQICIMRIGEINNLENFDPDTMEYSVVKLENEDPRDNNTAYNLDVMEYNSIQCIIVSTDHRIHIIEFN